MPKNHVILTLIIHATGSHKKAWKLVPDRDAFWTFEHYLKAAQIAHEGTFDSLWLPDFPMSASPPDQTPPHTVDPTLLMAALAAAVPDIGVVPTISTTYSHPYNVARQIATLDALSGGRGGINAITSYADGIARNFGDAQMSEYGDRYKRADEFLDVFTRLSDSWQIPKDGPFVEQGLLFPPEGRRAIDFDGEIFKVAGPLNVPQSRFGRPLISVAGGSEHTLDLAAKRADVLYAALVDKSAAIEFSAALRARTQRFGRSARSIKVMPGLVPVIGSTQEEAERKVTELAELGGYETDPVKRVAGILGIDPDGLHPDRPLTEEQLQLPKNWSRPIGFYHSITDVARRGNLTVRQLARVFQLDIGHRLVVGTPDVIAEAILDWWRDGACDGFAVRAQHLPEDARVLTDEVIPILRKAGAYPDHYKKESLRSRFGIEDSDTRLESAA